MDVIRKTVDTILKRPFLLLFAGIVVAISLLINTYNPVLPILMGVTSITKSTIFESIVATLQIISDPSFLPLIILAVLGGTVVLSFLGGLVLSGFMFSLSRTLDDLPAKKGEFLFGIKKYFKKVFLINLRTVMLTIVFSVFMMVACVPAIVVTKSAMTDRPEILAAALLIDFLTACVAFMGIMFFFSYILFWYPPIFKNGKKAFIAGKKVVDSNFWRIVVNFLIFDLVFAAFQYLIYLITNTVLKFSVSWIFWTMFLLTLVVYVFSSFKDFKEIKGNTNLL